jgi:hypothetical protein
MYEKDSKKDKKVYDVVVMAVKGEGDGGNDVLDMRNGGGAGTLE